MRSPRRSVVAQHAEPSGAPRRVVEHGVPAGETCVTAKISELDFVRPIPQGDTCVIESYAYAAGRTSVRVRLRAYREEPRTGTREQTTDSYFVFVAVDEAGSPTPVPDLTVEGDRCRKLRDAALAAEPDETR